MRYRNRMSRSNSVELAPLGHRWREALGDPIGWHTAMGFVALASITIGARHLAKLEHGEIASDWLLLTAIRSNLPLLGLGVAALLGLHIFGRGSLLLLWSDLERGAALRVFAGLLIVAITWRFLTADFDWVYGKWWPIDRACLVLLGGAAIWRPIAIIPFIVQLRLLQAPLHSGFDFALGVTPDGLPANALAAVAATAVVVVVVGQRRTAVVVSMLAAATAIEFFVSGRRKFEEGWIAVNDLGNFPLNGYHQGWLGNTDGGLASLLSSFFATFRWPLLIGTLVIEVGSIVLLARRRLLMLALASFVVFHLFVFLSFGFSFLEWSLVEIGLLVLLLGRVGHDWSAPAFRVIPVAVSMIFVFFGSSVFDPPTLFWFDGSVTYAYEFNAIDSDGNPRLLVANDFAPHESAFAFGFLHLGPTRPVAAGYGAMNRARLDDTASVSNFAELEALEDVLAADDPRRDQVVANLERFLLSTGNEPTIVDALPGGLTRYSTRREGQNYEAGTPLVELAVTRVTTLRTGDEVLVRREEVVEFSVDGDDVTVRWVDPPA